MTLALEINDVGLVLARDGELLAEEPGFAMLDGSTAETGAAAMRRARLKPLYAETRYWQDLGTAPLARSMPRCCRLCWVFWNRYQPIATTAITAKV